MSPNALRGEAALTIDGTPHLLRPSFEALVRAEQELGPLFALVERAGAGQLRLAEIAALFWFCLAEPDAIGRERVGQAVLDAGLAAAAAPLRALLGEILRGGRNDPPPGAVTFAASALRLLPLAAQVLRWTPAVFWAATPAELCASLAPPRGTPQPPTRDEIARLIERDDHG